MKLNLEVKTFDGVTTKVVAQFADFIAFEKETNRSVAKFQTELTLTDISWLAWSAQRRAKATALDFGSWVETVESVEVGVDNSAIIPLEKTLPTG